MVVSDIHLRFFLTVLFPADDVEVLAETFASMRTHLNSGQLTHFFSCKYDLRLQNHD